MLLWGERWSPRGNPISPMFGILIGFGKRTSWAPIGCGAACGCEGGGKKREEGGCQRWVHPLAVFMFVCTSMDGGETCIGGGDGYF
eukprot:scaffold106496_cov35-Tisochrysis_lutea.AAC.1